MEEYKAGYSLIHRALSHPPAPPVTLGKAGRTELRFRLWQAPAPIYLAEVWKKTARQGISSPTPSRSAPFRKLSVRHP